ncbi:MAG: SOS response-associated peptidase [Bacteroidota bacterium]
MCGRYSLSTSKVIVEKQLRIDVNMELTSNYNIAPTQKAVVIANDAPTELQSMRWGLIPNWSKTEKTKYLLINARSEGIESKASFRSPIRKRKCLVLADSFYEWKKQGKQKTPYRIHLTSEELMVFAGVWDAWKAPDETWLKSFTIITTTPNKEMEGLHDRMPVILPTFEEQRQWLLGENLEDSLAQLQPLTEGLLHTYEVSDLVGSYKNNGPALHQPIEDTRLF